MFPRSRIITFTICLLVFVINFLGFIWGASLEQESFIRILWGGFFIFLLPGFIWHDILGFRCRHVLERIALSFALTLTIEVLLLPIPFFFRSTINIWIELLLFISALGLIIQFFQIKPRLLDYRKFSFPLSQLSLWNINSLIVILVLILISYGTYKWGENLTDIEGEKLLQFIFVRYYYSMPLHIPDIGIFRGYPPANLIQLWEFLIAGWAALIKIDPLPLYFRARFVIPCLGLSAMYLLLRNIFSSRMKLEILFWGIIIMCFGWFILLSPSTFDWVKADPFRGLTAFMGTVHHSDAAMDVLLPLWVGLLVMTFCKPVWRNYLLLAGIIVAGFMWHPREFFQVALYTGIFGVMLCLFPTPHKKIILKRWGIILSIFCIVAMCFALAVSQMDTKTSQGYNQYTIRQTALGYAFLPENIIGIRNLFNFPFHLMLSFPLKPDTMVNREQLSTVFRQNWHDSLWLILSAFAVPILIGWGNRCDKFLALFYGILWFVTLGWNFSMLIVIVLTYSEFHMSTPRVLYLFAYILIADGLYVLLLRLSRGFRNLQTSFLVVGGGLGMGLLTHYWWTSGKPHFFTLSMILSVGVLLSGGLALFPKTPLPVILLVGTGLLCYWWWTTSQRRVWMTVSIFGLLFIISGLLSVYPKIQQRIIASLFTTRAKGHRERCSQTLVFITIVGSTFCFFLPILGGEYMRIMPQLLKISRPPAVWFEQNNYLGFSTKLIHFLRALPPKQIFLVYPLGKGLVSLYAPHYTVVFPGGICSSVISATPDLNEVRNGKHPLYPQGELENLNPESIKHDVVTTWLEQRKVDYILIQQDYYAYLLPYFRRFPDDYEFVFHHPEYQEIVVRYRKKNKDIL